MSAHCLLILSLHPKFLSTIHHICPSGTEYKVESYETICIKTRFKVVTAASTKATVFWDIAPCRVTALMMEVVITFETSADYMAQHLRKLSSSFVEIP